MKKTCCLTWCILTLSCIAFSESAFATQKTDVYQSIHALRVDSDLEVRLAVLDVLSSETYLDKAVFERVVFSFTEAALGVIESYPFSLRLQALELLGTLIQKQKEKMLLKKLPVVLHAVETCMGVLFSKIKKAQFLKTKKFLSLLKKGKYIQWLRKWRHFFLKEFRKELHQNAQKAYQTLLFRKAALLSLFKIFQKASRSKTLDQALDKVLNHALSLGKNMLGVKVHF